MRLNRISKFACLLLVVFMIGCIGHDESINIKDKYSLFIMNKNLGNTIITTNSIDSGNIAIIQQGVDLPTQQFDRSIIIKDGHFYHINENKFKKFELQQTGLKEIASIPMLDQHIENINWISKDTVLLFTIDNKSYSKLTYYKIAVNDFTVLQQQEIQLPLTHTDYKILSIGFSTLQHDRLIVGYTFNRVINETDFTTIDTMYMATLDPQTLQLQHIQKDTRSTYPGGINTVQSYSFKDEKGNFYFMSCPGIALGNNLTKPTAIFKINQNSTEIDPSYFFNLTAQTQNHAYGMWYLGNNEAIVRSERKDRYTDFSDHHSTYQFEYYLVDLIKQTTHKLALPYDKGTRKESVLVKNGKAYITIDDAEDQHQVWIYNIQTKRIDTGLKLDKETDFIVRIDQLY
ncbi:DUF4374 domain-containing protein [Sphingobacterium sp. SRCM116780]|uniref:DUF4374 domain-containing protein n=1 Tax=Sphingobacterium sp. SRCM116780 TaxID=2907623 RepID=UPI001F1B06DB|nr:DUF4374 domain-containing protein [Sphingobacterium sp. SRCM116780]UIR55511.1 DUF4374 domain-containing protein [Sphingobacterium sp. SRCM116780]